MSGQATSFLCSKREQICGNRLAREVGAVLVQVVLGVSPRIPQHNPARAVMCTHASALPWSLDFAEHYSVCTPRGCSKAALGRDGDRYRTGSVLPRT